MKNGYLEKWIEEASTVPSKIQLLLEDITEEQLNWKPHSDRWSIGELLDHLVVSNELYFPTLEQIAAGSYVNPFLGRFKKVHTFFANSILKAVEPESKKKYQTVRKFRPSQSLYSLDIRNRFEEHQQILIAYAKATDHADHARTIVASPALPFIVYSLENALRIILSHEFRHINQAMQLKQSQVTFA